MEEEHIISWGEENCTMYINESNEYLVFYRYSCQIESLMKSPDEAEVERQIALVAQDYLERMDEYPDRYKLSAIGSAALLGIFSEYRKKQRELLMGNREKQWRSQRKIKMSRIIHELELNEIEPDIAEEWVDFFLMHLTREGFFAWWQPQYSDDYSELWYYYSEADEADFLTERKQGNRE